MAEGARDIVAGMGEVTPPDGISVIPPPGAGRSEYCRGGKGGERRERKGWGEWEKGGVDF